MKCTKINIASIAFIVCAAFVPITFGQRFISSVSNGSMPVAKTNKRIAKVFADSPIIPITSPIELHKITYTSRDENGRQVNLTGLIAWPRDGAPKGLVVFNHGTIADRRASPSFYKGSEDNTEAESATLAFATSGYAVVMPDYLGLGDHKAFHPYPLNVVNSFAGVDIIVPARTFAKQRGYEIGSKLFITGYSEGGGVAMAQLRELEKLNGLNYQVTYAAPASGPYDLSGATREFMLQDGTDQTGFVVRLYLMAYMAQYFHKHAGLKLTDYFKPSMALTVSTAFAGTRSDKDVITRLALAATLMRAKNSIFNVITPKFEKAMRSLDRRESIVRALIENNVFDWSPKTPMLLINLEGDGVVDPANTEKAFRTMRNRGVGADSLRRYIIPGGTLTHVTAVPTAMNAARKFFDGGFGAIRDAQ